MKFGDYLRQKRAERGWTQPQAASRAKIEQSYLSKLENNKSIPSGDIYARLVEAYGIDAEEMAGILFPAELDRLREIDALRDLLLQRSQADIETPRRILIAGLAALMIGGGFLGFSQLEPARMLTQYTYQSTGVIAANAPSDTEIPPGARVRMSRPCSSPQCAGRCSPNRWQAASVCGIWSAATWSHRHRLTAGR